MKQIIQFIKDSLKIINPLPNIKVMHTNIWGDVLSGITVAVIALPLALAFGEISMLGPVAGVWGAIAGGVIGGLFGGCMVGVSGPTAPKATQIAAFMGAFVIGTTNNPDLVAAFSIIFLSGLILVFISLLKISRFIHYVPYSVVAGFMCGIGVIVILTQINAFLGLESKKNIYEVFKDLGFTMQNINMQALFVAIPSLLVLFLWPYLEKKYNTFSKIPSPLLALIIGTGIAYFMNLEIPYIGDKMNSAESTQIFTFYMPDFKRLSEFIFPAIALAGLAILDSLLSCIVADNMTGTRHNSDRETFGQGMANMAAGLLGGVTTATATMRTVANIKFGGKTPLASIVHGLTLLAILLGMGFLVAAIPSACLAAILFKVGVDILDYRILPILKKLPTAELFIFSSVLFITVFEDLMVAVAIGVVFAVINFYKEISLTVKLKYKHKIIPFEQSGFIVDNKKNKDFDKTLISVLQPEGPLFFWSIQDLIKIYRDCNKHKVLIVDMTNVTMIDLTAVYALEDIVNSAKRKSIKVYVSNAKSNVKSIFDKLNFISHLGKDYYIESKKSILSID